MGLQNGKSFQGEDSIQINHSMFQSAKILEEKSQLYMTISMHIEQEEYNKWSSNLDKFNYPISYLLLPQNHHFGNKGFCGSTGTVNIIYDLYPYLLSDEISKRKLTKSRFQQCQLWFLLYVLTAASEQMRKSFDSKIGDIRPHNIFLNKNGEIKVSCLKSWPREKSNFQKAHEYHETFLAPEEIDRLELGGSDDLKSYQAEIFSIGMTILSAALLNNFTEVYDIKNMKFDYEKAKKYLHEWKNNKFYSQILRAVVCNLCQFSPEKRVTGKQFWNWIKEYHKQIKNKKKFIIRKVPAKIENEVEQLRSSLMQNKIKSGIINQIPNRFESFYRTPILIPEKITFTRLVSPSNLVRHTSPALAYQNTVKSIGVSSLKQSLPISSVKQSQLHYKINLSDSVKNPEIEQKLQSKVDETQAENISKEINSTLDKEQKSQQVQVFFTSSESAIPVNSHQTSKEGHFVYTRRIVDPTTNSLLGEQSINSEQYHEGIIQKNLDVLHQINSVNILEDNLNRIIF